VQLPMTESLAFSSAFTFAAWIAPTTFGRERNLWRTPGAVLTLRAEGTVVPVAILSDEQIGFVSSGVLPLDIWSHVAMTYDGSMLRLYINGADAGSRAATGTLVPPSPQEGGFLGGASAFAGAIDELRLYRRALSASEIAADMTIAAEAAAAPLSVTSTTPVDQGIEVAISAAISATFSRPADAASVTAATVQLRDGHGQVVAASVTYDGAARTVTLTPTSPLAASAYYYARVLGGSGGVRAEDGGELTSDVQWSFRTAAAVAPPPPVSAAPHIASVSVYSGWFGHAVLVNGNNFGRRQGTSTVTINGTPVSVGFWSNVAILAIVPAAATEGPLVVTVDGQTSNAVTVQFHSPRKS
jgi:methionine-rich copper-binding protein CopC